jgi:hypothetical protein
MRKFKPFKFWVLAQFIDGEDKGLKTIYDHIGAMRRDCDINPFVFGIEQGPGESPKYKHRVRSAIKSLENNGWIKHVGKGKTGVYHITDDGTNEFERIWPVYGFNGEGNIVNDNR